MSSIPIAGPFVIPTDLGSRRAECANGYDDQWQPSRRGDCQVAAGTGIASRAKVSDRSGGVAACQPAGNRGRVPASFALGDAGGDAGSPSKRKTNLRAYHGCRNRIMSVHFHVENGNGSNRSFTEKRMLCGTSAFCRGTPSSEALRRLATSGCR